MWNLLKDYLEGKEYNYENVSIIKYNEDGHKCEVKFNYGSNDSNTTLDISLWDVLVYLNDKIAPQDIYKKMDFYQKESDIYGLEYIEKIAREHIYKHENIDEFMMCMGHANFLSFDNSVYSDELPKCDKLDSFLNKYDKTFKFTGTAMRFTEKGSIVTNW